MKYKLASSSTEEGEIKGNGFPFYKSHLQYYYYPLSTMFIGKNTVPNAMNYKCEGISQKLKKDLKADYPYILFNILDTNKPFFENKFKLFTTMSEAKINPLELIEAKSDLKEIENFHSKPNGEKRYDQFFQKFFFRKEENPLPAIKNASKIFCFEDRVLQYLDNTNAFIFLRVSEEKINSNTQPSLIKRYAFEDIFFHSANFYEFLEIYQEFILKGHKSEEIRTFSNGEIAAFVFSSTTFKNNGEVKRIFATLDQPNNSRLLFNKDGPKLISIQGRITKNENFIFSLDLPEGDYAINDKKICKLCNDGEYLGFNGLLYDDFIKTI